MPDCPGHHAPNPARRRGFAMVMVILLTLVAGLSITVILDRHGQAALAERRTIRGYQEHHEQQGLRDLVGTAIEYGALARADRTTAPEPVEIVLLSADGRRYAIVADDAHGRVLADGSGSAGPIMTQAAERLRAASADAEDRYLRTRGPARVSLATAEEPVLAAVLQAIDPDAPAATFAANVLKARREKPLAAQDINRLLKESGVDEEVISVALRCFTHESLLWRLKVEVTGRDGQVVSRHLGLLSGGLRSGATNAWTFLSFERVERFEPAGGPAAR